MEPYTFVKNRFVAEYKQSYPQQKQSKSKLPIQLTDAILRAIGIAPRKYTL